MGLEPTAVRTLSHYPIPLGHPSPLGKDKYWRAEQMVDHTVKVAIPASNAVLPNCQLVFSFDNASSYSSCAVDALRVQKG